MTEIHLSDCIKRSMGNAVCDTEYPLKASDILRRRPDGMQQLLSETGKQMLDVVKKIYEEDKKL